MVGDPTRNNCFPHTLPANVSNLDPGSPSGSHYPACVYSIDHRVNAKRQIEKDSHETVAARIVRMHEEKTGFD